MAESKQGSTDMSTVVVRSCRLRSMASRMDTPSPTTLQKAYLKANCTSSLPTAVGVIYSFVDCHWP